jgi:hypothetical protein
MSKLPNIADIVAHAKGAAAEHAATVKVASEASVELTTDIGLELHKLAQALRSAAAEQSVTYRDVLEFGRKLSETS